MVAMPEQEWQHLTALVDALVSDGNEVTDGGFQPNQGGWDCWMAQPLNFDLLRPLVEGDGHEIRLMEGPSIVGTAGLGFAGLVRVTRNAE